MMLGWRRCWQSAGISISYSQPLLAEILLAALVVLDLEFSLPYSSWRTSIWRRSQVGSPALTSAAILACKFTVNGTLKVKIIY
ncbi:hypothetical protein BKA61DRAFT_615837 [Leptodontidium sp. MPI-SDFR-AT-0119]|nr:hypothetical protein BKA61DRAFT_615837 [Leptodontidium sp. MPI-SDFR-AT-0119]